jgi:hypothetical protein
MSTPKDNADILGDTIEALELTVRSARRCAYDLKHCADSYGLIMFNAGYPNDEMVKLFRERADYFVKFFQHGNSMKDYRHNLHRTIEELESRVETLRGLLAEHKIDDPTIF